MRLDRRDFLALSATAALAATGEAKGLAAGSCGSVDFIDVPLDVVPVPKNIAFAVTTTSGRELTLRAHYWYHAPAMKSGKRLPAIVDFNPYRRRDGMLYVDSMMYPWFSYNEYLCFRVDLHGSGDSDGTMTDEYTEDELRSCVQIIEQIAKLPFCDGNVGMMGKSWSAINSLVVAARDDCPSALKAVVFCCGTDDRFNDDVHYMGGAQMYDQPSWAASMWGWLPMPPDPEIVGDKWKEMWRERVRALNFWFEPWATHQTRDEYWRKISVRDHYDKVKVPVFAISGWLDGYKNPAERAVRALGGLGKPVAGILGPWGHKYPFDGYPGPRVDWLRYIVPHWWDRCLKGETPDESSAWPQLSVWLGDSREPDRVPDYVDRGTWVAEDHDWQARVRAICALSGFGTFARAGTGGGARAALCDLFGPVGRNGYARIHVVGRVRQRRSAARPARHGSPVALLRQRAACSRSPVLRLPGSHAGSGVQPWPRGDRGAFMRSEPGFRKVAPGYVPFLEPRVSQRRTRRAATGAGRAVYREAPAQRDGTHVQTRLEAAALDLAGLRSDDVARERGLRSRAPRGRRRVFARPAGARRTKRRRARRGLARHAGDGSRQSRAVRADRKDPARRREQPYGARGRHRRQARCRRPQTHGCRQLRLRRAYSTTCSSTRARPKRSPRLQTSRSRRPWSRATTRNSRAERGAFAP